MITTRRRFLAGLGALLAAPAIVRVAAIMPVRAIKPHVLTWEDILMIRAKAEAVAIKPVDGYYRFPISKSALEGIFNLSTMQAETNRHARRRMTAVDRAMRTRWVA